MGALRSPFVQLLLFAMILFLLSLIPYSYGNASLTRKGKIEVYDYEANKLHFYKSISCISIDRAKKSQVLVARKRIKNNVHGYFIFADTNPDEASKERPSLQLEFWIGLNENNLIEFLESFDYVKTEKVLNDTIFIREI